MKWGKFTFCILMPVIFTACSKDELLSEQPPGQVRGLSAGGNTTTTASAWESAFMEYGRQRQL